METYKLKAHFRRSCYARHLVEVSLKLSDAILSSGISKENGTENVGKVSKRCDFLFAETLRPISRVAIHSHVATLIKVRHIYHRAESRGM